MTMHRPAHSEPMHSFSSFPRPSRVPFALVLACIVAVVIAGCATRTPVPVEERAVPRPAVPRPPAPVAQPAPAPGEGPGAQTYTVKRGDTLHQIALDNGLDYRELAAWNNIENVNRIYPGQVLRLTAPGEQASAASGSASGVTTAPLRSPPPIGESGPIASPATPPPPPSPAPVAQGAVANVKTSPKAIKEPYSEQAVRDMNLAASAVPAPTPAQAAAPAPGESRTETRASSPAASTPPSASSNATAAPTAGADGSASTSSGDGDQLQWSWPAKGRIVTNFSETANLKGIDIAGTAGEPVRASAPGRVVYAGSGLRGYGKLIIIKHNATYLSAYAHNREILVKEGQQVTRGQKIAEMGNTDADQVKLHFEIRRHGKPMDPAKFLPPT